MTGLRLRNALPKIGADPRNPLYKKDSRFDYKFARRNQCAATEKIEVMSVVNCRKYQRIPMPTPCPDDVPATFDGVRD